MSHRHLQLVEIQPFEEELEVRSNSAPHSLHKHLMDTDAPHPDIARFLVSRYSKQHELVLDPMCGSGTVGLETALMGRGFIGLSSDPLAIKISKSRLQPIDFAELAIKLQFMDLKRPVDVRYFTQDFSLFFDVETFCELMNCRRALMKERDIASSFIDFILLGLLHGHTASHLSVYTDPQRALSGEEQARLNRKRHQVPGPRPIVSRILKKGAELLRDGIPSIISNKNSAPVYSESDPREMSKVQAASVSLSISRIPSGVSAHESWLRRWFVGEVEVDNSARIEAKSGVDFWNTHLFELARVVKNGGRSVIFAPGGNESRINAKLGSEITNMTKSDLSRYWSVEGHFVWDVAKASPAADSHSQVASNVFVLRRK